MKFVLGSQPTGIQILMAYSTISVRNELGEYLYFSTNQLHATPLIRKYLKTLPVS
jgi:hypothetical protein